jgi:serine/threonine-protein kinase
MIGAGGMGEVYRARDTNLGRAVALKVLPEALARDEARVARFEREARTLATLQHPNVATIYGFEQAEGLRFLVMELVEGEDLSTRLTRGALPVEEAVLLAAQVAEGLEAAHEQGIVHRDLKPANIRITPDHKAKILDFGLARALEGGPDDASSAGSGMAAPGAPGTAAGGAGTEAGAGTAASGPGPAVGGAGAATGAGGVTGATGVAGGTGTSGAGADAGGTTQWRPLTAEVTRPGTVLGTAAYMSPEQARGHLVDRRADIWAFGCVLYEMLAGRRPFVGETSTDLLAEIVKAEPDWKALPDTMPARVRVLLWRCLQKDPRRRLRDIGEARYELSEAPSDPSASFVIPGSTVEDPPRRGRWVGVGIVLGIIMGALSTNLWMKPNAPSSASDAAPSVTRFVFHPTDDFPDIRSLWNDLAVSPDGETIVYCTNTGNDRRFAGGNTRFAVRRTRSLELTRLSDSQGGVTPFFSPDGEFVGYYDYENERLMRLPANGGQAIVLCDSMSGSWGSHWGEDGAIYHADFADGLHRISVDDGTREVIARADREQGEGRFTSPFLLPDRRTLLIGVVAINESGNEQIHAIDLESGERRRVLVGSIPIGLTPAGHLIFRRGDAILVQRFDWSTLTPRGASITLVDGVSDDFALSRSGTLVYAPGASGDRRPGRMIWVDRDGNVEPVNDEILTHPRYPRFSPDGESLVITFGPAGQGQLWVYDLVGGRPPINLTFEAHNVFGVWSRDAQSIAFKQSPQVSEGRLLTIAADGSEMKPTHVETNGDANVCAWTSDRRLIYWAKPSASDDSDIFIVSPEEGSTPEPLVTTPFNEEYTDLSPDERWLAYQSDRSGRTEIWVQPFPSGAPVRVSADGGQDPVWSADGTELYYQKGTVLMVVKVTATEPRFTFEPATQLFRDRFEPSESVTPRTYHVHPDGRFLMIDSVHEAEEETGFIVIQNWFDEIDRQLATGAEDTNQQAP